MHEALAEAVNRVIVLRGELPENPFHTTDRTLSLA
jgi:hypothetical protein